MSLKMNVFVTTIVKKYLLRVESASDDVLRVFVAHMNTLVQRELLPQEFLVVGQLDHQGAIEHLLQPLGEEKRNEMAEMETAGRRTSSRVKVKLLSLFVRVQNQVEISILNERHYAYR